MPFVRSKYPDNWERLVAEVKARAGNACEWCKVYNGMEGKHLPEIGWLSKLQLNNQHIFLARYTRVVLTTAHLDADGDVCQCERETGRKCGNLDHLRSLCQSCHLRYDHPRHMRNAAASRRRKALTIQPEFFAPTPAAASPVG